MNSWRAVLPAVAVAVGAPVAAADGTTVSAGFDYSTGKYGGTASTDILYVPLVIKHESGPLILKLTIPHVQVQRRVTTPGSTVVAVGDETVPVSTDTTSTATETVSGLGDSVAAATYNVYYDPAGGWLFDVSAKAKIATGDQNQGLSTGKNDYALQLDVYKTLGAASVLGSAGYKWMGQPVGSSYRNVPYASAGLAYKVSDKSTAGLIVDYRRSVLAGSASQRELTLYLAQHLGSRWKAQGYVVAGLSDTSPQAGIGIQLGCAF